jgi:hypothetical protein
MEIGRTKIDLTTDFRNITKMLANVSTRALGVDFTRVQKSNGNTKAVESDLQYHTSV